MVLSLDELVRDVEAKPEEVIGVVSVVSESVVEVEEVSAAVVVVSGGEESLPDSLGSPILMKKTYFRMSLHEFEA